MNQQFTRRWTVLALLLAACPTAFASAPGTAFTYQGRLDNNGSPASGNFSMSFTLWNDPDAGQQVGPTLTFDGAGANPAQVSVSNGLFTVPLDFGVSSFVSNNALWLEVTVAGTTLSPRQPLAPMPFALNTRGVVVDAAGNVGIGTSSPTANLQVNGQLYVHNTSDSISRVDSSTGSPKLTLTTLGQLDWHIGIDRNDLSKMKIGPGLDFSANVLTVTNSNKLGIATTTPTATLDVAGAIRALGGPPGTLPFGAGYTFSNPGDNDSGMFSTGDGLLQFYTNNAEQVRINLVGDVGIGTTNPAQKLDVSGNISATGSITCCSDARFKKNVTPLHNALSLVEKLEPVRFNWRCDEFPDRNFSNRPDLGLIAQQVRTVVPEVVKQGSDGYFSVDYGRLTPIVIQAVKELKAENADLRARLERLEAALQAVDARKQGA